MSNEDEKVRALIISEIVTSPDYSALKENSLLCAAGSAPRQQINRLVIQVENDMDFAGVFKFLVITPSLNHEKPIADVYAVYLTCTLDDLHKEYNVVAERNVPKAWVEATEGAVVFNGLGRKIRDLI